MSGFPTSSRRAFGTSGHDGFIRIGRREAYIRSDQGAARSWHRNIDETLEVPVGKLRMSVSRVPMVASLAAVGASA